jgi:hypothetical protein
MANAEGQSFSCQRHAWEEISDGKAADDQRVADDAFHLSILAINSVSNSVS